MLMRKKTRTKRLIGYVLLTALLGAMISLLTADGSADTSAAVTEERFTNYRQPTGPELTPQEAAEKAVQRVLTLERPSSPSARSLASGEVSVEVAHSNLGVVRAVENGLQPAEAVTTGTDIEQSELLRSAAYLVKIVGQFSPMVPIPHKATAPRGSVMWLTLDAHTGFMLGLQLGGAPNIAALGPVARFSFGVGSETATAAEPLDQRRGLLIGTVYRFGNPVKGWRIVVVSGRTRDSSRSAITGSFAFHLLPGTYSVTALGPRRTLCARRTVRIFRRHNSYIALRCQ